MFAVKYHDKNTLPGYVTVEVQCKPRNLVMQISDAMMSEGDEYMEKFYKDIAKSENLVML